MSADAVHQPTAEVEVKSLVTGERTKFVMPLAASLDETWEEAYAKLEEAKREGDTFQCAAPEEGKSLMGELGLTLEQAREQRVCGSEACHYEIKGPSGGAAHVVF
jgi:hypothetical protein